MEDLSSVTVTIAESMLRQATPLVLTATSALVLEKSGIADLAIESKLMLAAFTAAAVMNVSHHLLLTAAITFAVAIFWVVGFAWLAKLLKADQVVLGTALNIVSLGLIPVLCKSFFGSTGGTGTLLSSDKIQLGQWRVILALAVVLLVVLVFKKTKIGLWIRAAGDSPQALESVGISRWRVRFTAAVFSAVSVSLAGILFSLEMGSGYVREMTVGKGYLALAAVILGGWDPLKVGAACLFFAFADAVQIQLQSHWLNGIGVSNSLIQSAPYVFTLFLLVFRKKRSSAPIALNQY